MVVPWQADLPAHDHENHMKETQKFVSSDSTTAVDINDGPSFHREEIDFRQPAAYVTDLEERLELARAVQNKIRRSRATSEALKLLKVNQDRKTFQLELMHLAVFLFADIAILRREAKYATGIEIAGALSTTESFLGIFLQRKSSQIKQTLEESDSDDDEGARQPRAKRGGSIDLDPNERHRALERDGGVCMFSGTVDPEAAHIWPFAINSTVRNMRNLRSCLIRSALTLNPVMRRKLEWLFGYTDEPGSSDKAWNMASVNVTGCDYWEKAYFGLQWVGVRGEESGTDPITEEEVTYTIFNVMFHWLSPKIRDAIKSHLRYPMEVGLTPKQLVRLETSQDLHSLTELLGDAFNEPHPQYSTKGVVLQDQHGRQIETGRIFSMKVDRRDLDNMKTLIDAQWLAIQMAAFSGAGEVAYDLDRGCPPDYLWVMYAGQDSLSDGEKSGGEW